MRIGKREGYEGTQASLPATRPEDAQYIIAGKMPAYPAKSMVNERRPHALACIREIRVRIFVSGMGNRKSDEAFNRWCYGLRRLEEAKLPILIIIYGEEVEVQGLHTPLKFVPCFIQEKLRKL